MLKRKAWVYKSVMNVLSKACLFQRNESPRVRHEAIGVLVPGQGNILLACMLIRIGEGRAL